MRKRVYVAGPYTKGDCCINTNTAIKAGQQLWDAGYLVPFVPHLTHFWHTMLPQSYDMWLAYDMFWLETCDILVRLPGESSGADKEVARARELRIPVMTLEEALTIRLDAAGRILTC